MAKITSAQFLDTAFRFNVDDETAARMLAIAMAESGLDVTARHGNANGSTDYGLMQINSVHLKPGGQLNGYSVAQLLTPEGNLGAAQVVSNTWKNWTPWVAYKTGSYLLHVPSARQAVREWRTANPGGISGLVGGITGTASTAAEAASTAAGFLGKLADPSIWLRVAYVAGGILLAAVAASKVAGASPVKIARKVTR